MRSNEIHHNVLHASAPGVRAALVHIKDACEAQLFGKDQLSMAGRFFYVAGYPTIQYYAACFVVKYPEHKMLLKRVVGEDVRVPGDSSKLVELGFKFKYCVKETLDCHRIRRMRQENGRALMVIIK
ncbi:hypothetical protein ZWY2020_059875 [Hordeum vulgare]|nr:hypothetical protein ZWY2020_059875 [Hordeum vulgare]